ncbi:pentatricopeptide repeat-containing protein At2g45350, chloroplastic-like [Nymphaea colorata]|nr:pentatricopeptide repeat-containing protein At2g45350, chloroplastic-like [Nymphaea colorata]
MLSGRINYPSQPGQSEWQPRGEADAKPWTLSTSILIPSKQPGLLGSHYAPPRYLWSRWTGCCTTPRPTYEGLGATASRHPLGAHEDDSSYGARQRRNSFTWNSLIRFGEPEAALTLFCRMLLDSDASPDRFTFPFLLKACSRLRALEEGRQLHCSILKSGSAAADDPFVLNTLLHFYASCGSIDDARRLFDRLLPSRDVVSWNALLGHEAEPLEFFGRMLGESEARPDGFTFSLLLRACTRSSSTLREGKQVHAHICKSRFSDDVFVCNALIHMYCGAYQIEAGRQLFDRMPSRDPVSWNTIIDGFVKNDKMAVARQLFDSMPASMRSLIAFNTMISGYAKAGDVDEACRIFNSMPERDSVTWNTMINGYAKVGRMDLARQLFDQMPERDTVSWSHVINGYAKVGRIDLARSLFDEMPRRDVLSWNVMIAGYVESGLCDDALNVFHEMKLLGFIPDRATLVIALSATADLGSLDEGRRIHDDINRNNVPVDGVLGAALLDMYCKCGAMDAAIQIFRTLQHKELDHWNTMIGGLALHGDTDAALALFSEMEKQPLQPNDITFIAVLTACSHGGLVHEGRLYFEFMRTAYNIKPKVQHYGCMVDILGRAGLLEEAMQLVGEMPMEPNAVVWRSLLGACRNHGNLEIGAMSAGRLIELDPQDSSTYILLSNLYASMGMWDDANSIRKMMRAKEIRKVPGCSSIEVDGGVYHFLVGDRSHPQSDEMYSLLSAMNDELGSAGYVAYATDIVFCG